MHIGKNVYIKDAAIIGIFDIDRSEVSDATRITLSDLQKSHKIDGSACGGLLPKSLVLTDGRAYLSPISAAVLSRREY